MIKEAAGFGTYSNDFVSDIPKIQIVTIQEMMDGARMKVKMVDAVVKRAAISRDGSEQLSF